MQNHWDINYVKVLTTDLFFFWGRYVLILFLSVKIAIIKGD